jgi:hypothetical protein
LKTIDGTVHLRDIRRTVTGVTAEAKESPLLRLVTRKRLVKPRRGIGIVESCYQVTTSESRLRRFSVE